MPQPHAIPRLPSDHVRLVDGSNLKPFLLNNGERVKAHAIAVAKKHERPFEYLASPIRKGDEARKLAERDGEIEQELVCIFSTIESCGTYSFRFCKVVDELSEGMVLKPAVKYQRISISKGVPRDNH